MPLATSIADFTFLLFAKVSCLGKRKLSSSSCHNFREAESEKYFIPAIQCVCMCEIFPIIIIGKKFILNQNKEISGFEKSFHNYNASHVSRRKVRLSVSSWDFSFD